MKKFIHLTALLALVLLACRAAAGATPTAPAEPPTATVQPPAATVAPPTATDVPPSATPVSPTPEAQLPAPAPSGERSTADRPDDAPGMYQVHLLYVLPSGAQDRQRDLDGKINTSIEAANNWLSGQTGGSNIRFDTYQGQLDITFLELDMTSDEIYDASVAKYGTAYWIRDILEEQLSEMDIFAPGKIYLGLFEIARHPSTCDDAAYPPDLMGRLAGIYPSAAVEAGWNCADENSGGNFGVGSAYADLSLIHELFHLLGYAAACGMNPASADNTSHTGDFNNDLMWAPGPDTPSDVYWDTDNMQLDLGNDDYYNHTIPNCPDLADSAFLDPLPANPATPPGWLASWLLP